MNTSSKNLGKLFIIDGHSLCYRAYYAIGPLSNSKGEATNAIYGFLTMMQKMVKGLQPDHLVVCFDRPEPTFRHLKFDDYKAHRKPMPEDLIDQVEAIKELCRAFRYPIYEKAGFEADDVIATLACAGAKKGYEVFIVTGDKDAMQLVNDQIKILQPHKDNLIIDIAGVKKKFDGLGPEKVVDLMALIGDASDNVPGVRGIGEKTAMKLIHQFGSVDELIANREKISSKSQRQLIETYEKDLLLSRELVRVDTSVPLEIDWDGMKMDGPDQAKLVEFLKRYEFRAQLREFAEPEPAVEAAPREYNIVATDADWKAFLKELEQQQSFSVDTETTSAEPMVARLVGLSFSWRAYQAWYIPVQSEVTLFGLPEKKVIHDLKPILEDSKRLKTGQNIKYDWMVLVRHGIRMQGIDFDTMIASYLLNPSKLNHNLDDISLEHLGVRKIPTTDLIGSGSKQISMADVPLEKISEYACEDADCVWRLRPILEKKLEEAGLEKLFREVEIPLALVLGKIEMNGVAVDRKYLAELSAACGKELDALTQEIYQIAGGEFNINSPKQLSEILFERLKLPVVRKTKTGYSTDVSVLEKLAPSHELPKKILDYRENAKLKSTYLDALPEMIAPSTGLIHTSYHQTTTATGRLSSSDPNLQNIPIRTEQGRRVRKAFVSRHKSGFILSADYSQIELRVLAHLSADPQLVKAFQEDRDIHRFTATLLYGVKEAEVTRPMRDLAKVINFSIIYGKTAYGLSQDLQISISEAETFIQNYFKRYAKVKAYLENQLELARKQGYLTTLLGRRAYFPDIHSKNGNVRQFAERAAINAPIQGSAADLIKLAMIGIQDAIEKQELQSVMIMQVHDELVFDALESEQKVLEALVKSRMEKTYRLEVPLKVDAYQGDSWFKT